MHFQYAFLMAPRFFRNMHFSMGKCILFLLFCWLQKMHISYFVDFVQKLRFSWNYAFLMVPRFFRNMHFSMGKCIFFCFSAGCRKMHISYFVDFVQKPRFSWNYAFLMAPRFFPEIWNYAFSAASRKAKKNAFSHGKMHISEKSWNHQKCIIP